MEAEPIRQEQDELGCPSDWWVNRASIWLFHVEMTIRPSEPIVRLVTVDGWNAPANRVPVEQLLLHWATKKLIASREVLFQCRQ